MKVTVASEQNSTVVSNSVRSIDAMEHSSASTAMAMAIAMLPVVEAAKVAASPSKRGTGSVAADLRQDFRLGLWFARP